MTSVAASTTTTGPPTRRLGVRAEVVLEPFHPQDQPVAVAGHGLEAVMGVEPGRRIVDGVHDDEPAAGLGGRARCS